MKDLRPDPFKWYADNLTPVDNILLWTMLALPIFFSKYLAEFPYWCIWVGIMSYLGIKYLIVKRIKKD